MVLRKFKFIQTSLSAFLRKGRSVNADLMWVSSGVDTCMWFSKGSTDVSYNHGVLVWTGSLPEQHPISHDWWNHTAKSVVVEGFLSISISGGRILALKDIHFLILRTCQYVAFHGQRDFVHVLTLRTLRWPLLLIQVCPIPFSWLQGTREMAWEGPDRHCWLWS